VCLTLLVAQAVAAPHGKRLRQQEELPPPMPLDDPYVPAGDPDILALDDGPGEEPSPLNPQGN
jgi:hypothetical protein